MYQCTRERQLLLHTSRESPCLTVFEAFYLRVDGFDGVVAFVNSGAEKRGKEVQVLLDSEILIERELAWHIPYPTTYLTHLLHHIVAIYRRRTSIRQQQRTEDAKHRRLAGSIGAYQSEDLTLADRKRHIAERQHLAVRFTDVLYLYCVHSFSSPYIPIFTKPSFLIATLTAYTRSARSSSVRIVLGVNSERDDIQLMVPAYSLR